MFNYNLCLYFMFVVTNNVVYLQCDQNKTRSQLQSKQ